jgi:hypothetical protein
MIIINEKLIYLNGSHFHNILTSTRTTERIDRFSLISNPLDSFVTFVTVIDRYASPI